MRDIEEIKRNEQLRFMHNPFAQYAGILKFKATGYEASFCFGENEGGNEHLSIEMRARRLPRWEEMCEVKSIFWKDEEEVIQIHPKKSEYVNLTEALHLWRPKDGDWNRLMNGTR